MRRVCVAILIAIYIPVSAMAAIGRDRELCDRLKSFEEAPFNNGSDGKPVRRFVEFQWSDSWLTGGPWGCRHTLDDTVSKSFCSYLMDDTNQEFSADLPMRILTCHGYVFPNYSSDWSDWTADIRLRGSANERSLDLGIYLRHGTVDAAMRLSAIPNNPGGDDHEPPPLKSTPSVADKTP